MLAKSKQIKITDTTFRDAHQSLWATRMKTEEILPILSKIDEIGYWSLEMWGGATFDVCLRYLYEDPWERLSLIKKYVKKTKLQMLLRGQNIVGYRNYPDDLLEAFIEKSVERGIDIFRIFDALNDIRNIEKAIEFVRKYKKHAQGTLCYTISPIHTIEYYLEIAKKQLDLGIDSICIKDMAGILAPHISFELIKRLKEDIRLPVQLHTHASSGMAVASYLKAIEAGVDIVDTAHGPLSFGTSQPAIETLIAMLDNTQYTLQLNKNLIEEVSNYLEQIKNKRDIKYDKIIDEMVTIHQIPGGMVSNLIVQLKQQNAEHRLREVLEEVPKVRKDLGYPPLVTPTSQIVGVQAVFNVLTNERYKIIPNEVKDYVRGLYGKPPVPIKDTIRRKILGNERPISQRPANLLEPVLNKIKKEVNSKYIKKEEDFITFALFPEIAINFFETRDNPEKLEIIKQDEGKNIMKQENKDDMEVIRELIELAAKHNLAELEWECSGHKIKIRKINQTYAVPTQQISNEPQIITKINTPSQPQSDVINEIQTPSSKHTLEQIKSPMVGTFYSRPRPDAPPFVNINDVIEAGSTLCIIEAMKLMNEIEAEKKCRIVEILAKDGQTVEYGQPLFTVEPMV